MTDEGGCCARDSERRLPLPGATRWFSLEPNIYGCLAIRSSESKAAPCVIDRQVGHPELPPEAHDWALLSGPRGKSGSPLSLVRLLPK